MIPVWSNEHVQELVKTINTLRAELVSTTNRLTAERDEARQRTNLILTEIDCRIEHGAESNGHLEAIRSLFEVGALTERLSLAIHERDQARREVCNLSSQLPRLYAGDRGWDCFKEEQ